MNNLGIETASDYYSHILKKKQTPSTANITAKIDMIETVKICESLKKKSFESRLKSLPILLEVITTETRNSINCKCDAIDAIDLCYSPPAMFKVSNEYSDIVEPALLCACTLILYAVDGSKSPIGKRACDTILLDTIIHSLEYP